MGQPLPNNLTIALRLAFSKAVHNWWSAYCPRGSRLYRIVPAKSTGSWGITARDLQIWICYSLKIKDQLTSSIDAIPQWKYPLHQLQSFHWQVDTNGRARFRGRIYLKIFRISRIHKSNYSPDPVLPIMATFSPAFTVKDTSERARGRVGWYRRLKFTFYYAVGTLDPHYTIFCSQF